MENFNAINNNAQVIKESICTTGDGGEDITQKEIDLIENSFSIVINKLFNSLDCVVKQCNTIDKEKIIDSIAKKMVFR